MLAVCSRCLLTAAARSCSRPQLLKRAIHAVSYFDFSRPDFLPSRHSSSDADVPRARTSPERYLPPLSNTHFSPQTEAQHSLVSAPSPDASWDAYTALSQDEAASLPREVFDLLLELQCRRPLKGHSKAHLSQTVDRILQLCRDSQQHNQTSSSSAVHDLGHVSPFVSLRLLYLLIVEEEQKPAPVQGQYQPLRPDLVQLLTQHVRKVEQAATANILESSLRGRLISLLSRLSQTDLAYEQLQKQVDALAITPQEVLDSRPFELLLGRLAQQAEIRTIEFGNAVTTDQDDLLLKTLRLALRARVGIYNQVLRRCLRTMESSTLLWLLPFQPREGVDPSSSDATTFSPRPHPWQTSATEAIETDAMQAFGDCVAYILAEKNVLSPALHILQSSSTTRPSRQDLVLILLRQIAGRMRQVVISETIKTVDDHLILVNDLRLVTQVYQLATTNGIQLTADMHRFVLHAFSACLLTSIANLGQTRYDFPHFPEELAKHNEQNGSKDTFFQQLRRFTSTVLANDVDLNGGSLDFDSHATLLGLHMRARDFRFSKRLYQLIRHREPSRQVWSDDPSQSLYHASLHSCAAPDASSFSWLFVQATRFQQPQQFAMQLYLDWMASDKVLNSSLSGIFMQSLLSARLSTTAHRVLEEMQDNQIQVPRRLAKAFIISFADAGFPEFAVEMAAALASQGLSQQLTSSDTTQQSASALRLGASLQIVSIALDRASKADMPWSAQRQQGIFRLFEEFRLGLTHQIIHTSSLDNSANPRGSIAFATRKHVRFAYNAAMRAHIALQPSLDATPHQRRHNDSEEKQEDIEPILDRVVSETSRDEIQKLLQELKDLDTDPDSDTWTILLLASLSQTVQGQGVGEKKLLEAVQIFFTSTTQSFTEQGVPVLCENDAKVQRTIPVQLEPQAVAELIHRLCDAKRTDLASDVYDAFQANKEAYKARHYPFAQYHHIERAYLDILASRGNRKQVQQRIDLLRQHRRLE